MTVATRFDELKAMGDLPSPSGVALEIMRLTQREDTSIQDLAKAIQTDPALSGRLLKLANSAYLGVRRPVVAIEDAIRLLGMQAIRHFALGISVLSNCSHGRCEGFDYRSFWSHSLATALAAQALAHLDRAVAPEESFTCGLLARVGQLALASIYPDAYAAVLLSVPGEDEPALIACEREKFAADHRELTGALLEDWGLPVIHVDGVTASYQPGLEDLEDTSRVQRLARQLHLAGRMAWLCVAQTADQPHCLAHLEELAPSLELDEALLGQLFEKVIQDWTEWGRLLDVPTQEVPSLAELKEGLQAKMKLQTSLPEAEFLPLKILLVSDDELNLKRLTGWLEDMGHAVISAGEGNEGLSLVLSKQPQVVICERRIPGMDCLEFCQSLRETKFGQQVYIIVLTCSENGDEVVQAFEAGADDHLAKPLSARLLQARLWGAQRLIRLRQEVEREREATRRYLAELAVANRRLEQMAMTDSLTALPNRRYAMERMEQAWAEYQRNGTPLSCLVVDLDLFKQINDHYGHDIGDGVLREIANVFRSSARSSDVVCRLGGEEFFVICANTTAAEALQVAERLRHAVKSHHWTVPGFGGNLSISVGLAASLEGMKEWDDLYRLADQALYDAKRKGRDQICMARALDGGG